MKSLNRAEFIGHVGNDIELRYMPSGEAVANISLACGDSYKDKNGVKQDRTEWVKLVAFGKSAEILAQYVKKGSKLYAAGRMQTRSYDKDGVKMYSTEVVITDFLMLDSARSTEPADTTRPAGGQGAGAPPQTTADFDDDIPF